MPINRVAGERGRERRGEMRGKEREREGEKEGGRERENSTNIIERYEQLLRRKKRWSNWVCWLIFYPRIMEAEAGVNSVSLLPAWCMT